MWQCQYVSQCMKMRYNRERDFQLHHKPSVGWPMHPDALGSSQRFPINSLAGSGSEGGYPRGKGHKSKGGKGGGKGKDGKGSGKESRGWKGTRFHTSTYFSHFQPWLIVISMVLCSTSSRVSTGIGKFNRLRADKPLRYASGQPGQLTLAG